MPGDPSPSQAAFLLLSWGHAGEGSWGLHSFCLSFLAFTTYPTWALPCHVGSGPHTHLVQGAPTQGILPRRVPHGLGLPRLQACAPASCQARGAEQNPFPGGWPGHQGPQGPVAGAGPPSPRSRAWASAPISACTSRLPRELEMGGCHAIPGGPGFQLWAHLSRDSQPAGGAGLNPCTPRHGGLFTAATSIS